MSSIQANVTNGNISDSTNAAKRAQSTGTGAEPASAKAAKGTSYAPDTQACTQATRSAACNHSYQTLQPAY